MNTAKPESGEAENSDAPSDIDPYELAEPAEVVSKIPESVYTDVVSIASSLFSLQLGLEIPPVFLVPCSVLIVLFCETELGKVEGEEGGPGFGH